MSGASAGYFVHHGNSRVSNSSGTLQARLHNFVKYALLQQLVPPGSIVCDLYCGRGVDIEKWAGAQIGRYVGVDFISSTLEEAREQWNKHNRPYCADFCEADPSEADLDRELRHLGIPADFVTCMGHLQDSFIKEDTVRGLLQNVASILKPGGVFFGITADSSTIWSKYQKAVEGAHRAGIARALPRVHTEHYIISFEDDRFTPFGTKYTLQFADGVTAEGQQLIHFPSLIRLAEEAGLEYIELQNLQEFYDDYRIQFSDVLRATCSNLVDAKGKLPQFAHDVLSLYTTFIFKKADYLDPDYMVSPLLLPDEDQLETYCEDAHDGNRPSQQEHFLPGSEHNIALKRLAAEILHQNDLKENHLDEEHRGYPLLIQVEGNSNQSQISIAHPLSCQTLHPAKQSDSQPEVMSDAITPALDKVVTSEKNSDHNIQVPGRSLELEVNTAAEPPNQPDSDCKGHTESLELEVKAIVDPSADDSQHQVEPMETDEVYSERLSQQSTHQSSDPSGPSVDKQEVGAVDNLLRTSENNDALRKDALLFGDAPTSLAIVDGLTESSVLENEAMENNGVQECEMLLCSPRDGTAAPSCDPIYPQEDGSTPPLKSTGLMELDSEEKGRKKHHLPCDVKADVCTDDLIEGHQTLSNIRQEHLSTTSVETGGERQSPKHSTGRITTLGKEEATKRSALGGLHSAQQRGRTNKPHYPHHHQSHHPRYAEERQERFHGSRHHGSHSSHHSKASRERIGDHHHKSDLLSPTHKGDAHRSRSRNPHSSPTFVPFSQFVPQTEFPVFQSPNTPGLLGPAPLTLTPIRLLEPIVPLWPIPPPPLDRRPFPKSRTPRKLGTDRDAFGSRARKESPPKKPWKDSPPPGTES